MGGREERQGNKRDRPSRKETQWWAVVIAEHGGRTELRAIVEMGAPTRKKAWNKITTWHKQNTTDGVHANTILPNYITIYVSIIKLSKSKSWSCQVNNITYVKTEPCRSAPPPPWACSGMPLEHGLRKALKLKVVCGHLRRSWTNHHTSTLYTFTKLDIMVKCLLIAYHWIMDG